MYKVSLVLLITFAIISLSQAVASNADKAHGSLYYYHKFEKKHSFVPKQNVPLNTHYSNEKKIREELYKLENKVNKLKRKEGFKVRDLKRATLAAENSLAKIESTKKADDKVHEQREEAIKEQINHEERFREKYQKRFLRNHKKLAKALPDQEPEFMALEAFDNTRVQDFRKEEAADQVKLNEQRRKDMNEKATAQNQESHLEGEIEQQKTTLKTMKESFQFKIEALEAKEAELKQMTNSEANLDATRRGNEAEEAKRAQEGYKN